MIVLGNLNCRVCRADDNRVLGKYEEEMTNGKDLRQTMYVWVQQTKQVHKILYFRVITTEYICQRCESIQNAGMWLRPSSARKKIPM